MDPVEIELPSYRVLIARGALADIGRIAAASARAYRYAVISDDTVAPLYAGRVRSALGEGRTKLYTIPAGEEQKTRAMWSMLTDAMLADSFGRDTAVVALGGGVIGDLAGFVAATYMRGLPFIQVPTTLTAQVDAAIGGKTGVNLPEGKNLVGAFYQPLAVIADVATLRTLPDRDFRSGLAEVAKYALTLDLELLETLERDPAPVLDRQSPALEILVARCVRAKAETVARDE